MLVLLPIVCTSLSCFVLLSVIIQENVLKDFLAGKTFLFIWYSELESNKACFQTFKLTFFCFTLLWVSSFCSFNLRQPVVRGRTGASCYISFLAEHSIEIPGVSLGWACPHEWERQCNSSVRNSDLFLIQFWFTKDPLCSYQNTVAEKIHICSLPV